MKPITIKAIRAILTALLLAHPMSSRASDTAKEGSQPPQPPQTPNASAASGATGVDPATGLPVGAMAEPQWIAPDWQDSGQRLPDVTFDSLPMSEVVKQLCLRFSNSFDVIIPGAPQTPDPIGQSVDLNSLTVALRLKNVTATEIFNAMNLTFEAEQTAVRWQLRMNGDRPLALLKSVPMLAGLATPPSPPEKKRMVYFVGDLVGDGSHGSMTMPQIYDTFCKVYDLAFAGDKNGSGGGNSPSQSDIKFHEPSQLLIVSATQERLTFIQNTLVALRQKADMASKK